MGRASGLSPAAQAPLSRSSSITTSPKSTAHPTRFQYCHPNRLLSTAALALLLSIALALASPSPTTAAATTSSPAPTTNPPPGRTNITIIIVQQNSAPSRKRPGFDGRAIAAIVLGLTGIIACAFFCGWRRGWFTDFRMWRAERRKARELGAMDGSGASGRIRLPHYLESVVAALPAETLANQCLASPVAVSQKQAAGRVRRPIR